ncbi:MAG: hypothetical protein N4A40_14820 [Tissierellales bacterium]|nr:hypothetical protein [Tissierellales bacterium]
MNDDFKKKRYHLDYNMILVVIVFVVLAYYAYYNVVETNGEFGNPLATEANFEKLPNVFSDEELETGIIKEWSSFEHSAFYKEHSAHYENGNFNEAKKLPYDTVFFRIELDDLNSASDYKFDKNRMERIAVTDVKKSDLFYYYAEEKSNALDKIHIRAVMVLDQKEQKIVGNKYNNYMKKEMGLNFDKNYYEIMNLDDEWQIFRLGKELEQKGNWSNDLYTNQFYELSGQLSFKYIPSAKAKSNVELIYVTDVERKKMTAIESIRATYESSHKLDDGYEVSFGYEAEEWIESLYTSEVLDEYTVERLENGTFNAGDEVVIYKNPMRKIESIKPLKSKYDSVLLSGILEWNSSLKYDDYIKKLGVIDSNDKRYELLVDSNVVLDYIDYDDLENSLCKFEIIDGNYIVSVEPIINSANTTHFYRLLSVGDGKVELGYNNLQGMRGEEFDENERQWVNLSDDYKLYSDCDLEHAVGKSVSISINYKNEIDNLCVSNGMYLTDCYDGKEPLRRNEEPENTLSFAAIKRLGNYYEKNRFVGMNHVFGNSQVTYETKCYYYDYDFDYVKDNPAEWESLLNHEFDKVDKLKEIDVEKVEFDKDSIYLLSSDGRRNGYIKTLVKISPSEASMINGILYQSELLTDERHNIKLPYDSGIILLDNSTYNNYSHPVELNGWVLLGEKNIPSYVISSKGDVKESSYEEVKKARTKSN